MVVSLFTWKPWCEIKKIKWPSTILKLCCIRIGVIPPKLGILSIKWQPWQFRQLWQQWQLRQLWQQVVPTIPYWLLSLAAKQFHLNEKIGTFCENRFWLIFNLFSFLLRNVAVVEKKIKTCTKEFQEEEEKFASIKQRLWLNLNPQSTQIWLVLEGASIRRIAVLLFIIFANDS